MAAAVFRPTRGLLIFTLLCVLGLTDSLKQKEHLEKLKARVQYIEEKAESTKKNYDSRRSFLSGVLTEQQRSMDAMLKMLERAPPDMKQMHSVFKMVKTLIDHVKVNTEGLNDVDVAAENLKKKVREVKELIKQHEESHDEF